WYLRPRLVLTDVEGGIIDRGKGDDQVVGCERRILVGIRPVVGVQLDTTLVILHAGVGGGESRIPVHVGVRLAGSRESRRNGQGDDEHHHHAEPDHEREHVALVVAWSCTESAHHVHVPTSSEVIPIFGSPTRLSSCTVSSDPIDRSFRVNRMNATLPRSLLLIAVLAAT